MLLYVPLFTCPSDLFCTAEEIESMLLHMDSHTTDNITSIMLINTSNSISIPLSIIFNSSLTTGSIPLDWKVSYIKPIPKTSPPSSSPNNYRPISLLSLIGKTMERHIFHLISDHLKSNNTISDAQFCFRPRYSTECALLQCYQFLILYTWLK